MAALIFLALDWTLDLRNIVFGILGRDATLTNRTAVWEVVEAMPTNPIVGAGFMSFWSGARMEAIWAKLGTSINQAHNGYLEQYLNLGYIGVGFIVILMLSGLLKVRRHLRVDYPSAMLRLCLIMVAVLYNYTEASFYGLNNMWVLTLLSVIDIPYQRASERNEAVPEPTNPTPTL
jgi:exopolysaccharide production protein ExoQ